MEEELSPSPYKTKLNTRGTMRYEPIYLREILNGDLSQSVSTPVSINFYLLITLALGDARACSDSILSHRSHYLREILHGDLSQSV